MSFELKLSIVWILVLAATLAAVAFQNNQPFQSESSIDHVHPEPMVFSLDAAAGH